MKKNDWSLLVSAILYSFLFYQETAGLNFLLFNVMLIALLLYRNYHLLKSKVWISVAASALVSSFFIFSYGSALSLVANVCSLLILSALSINTRTSFLTGIALTCSSVLSSILVIYLDWIERKKSTDNDTSQRPFYVKIFLVIIPLLISIVFFFFYQNANPLFYNFTKNINLDFLTIGWFFFTYGGVLLLYGFFHNKIFNTLREIDLCASQELTRELAARPNLLNGLMRIGTENSSAVILLALLNILLLSVNILDLHFLWFDGTLPKGIDNKAFVHDGIGTLITSILTAILILLFYFRGELNFYSKNKWLKMMAYTWIAQNAFMLFSTAYRNNMYIQESGLSYKKIGVYVYLMLTLIGLFTTFIKIRNCKTNWYLFRINAAYYFYILVFSCIINWDLIITNYNIAKNTKEHKKLEKYLLLDLSYKNIPQLLNLPDSLALKDDWKARDYFNYLRGTYYFDYPSGLSQKLFTFLKDYKQLDWPSTCIEKTRVYNEISDVKDRISSLTFRNLSAPSIQPIVLFQNINMLEFTNCTIDNLNGLKLFPKLAQLRLRNCDLDSLSKVPTLTKLVELDITGNNIHDLKTILKFRNLRVLKISNLEKINGFVGIALLKELERLELDNIDAKTRKFLHQALPNLKVVIRPSIQV